MLNFLKNAFMAAIIMVTACLSVSAAEEEKAASGNLLVGEARLDVSNNYYFRGDYLFDEGTPSLFPSLTLGFEDPALSLNIWSAVPVTKRGTETNSAASDELDFTLDYSLDLNDSWSLSTGLMFYTNPFIDDFYHTEELYAVVAYKINEAFSVSTGLYGDIDALKGIYWTVGPQYTTKLCDKLDWTSNAIFSLVKYKGESLAVVETGAKTELSYAAADSLAVIGSLLYNYNVDKEKHLYSAIVGASYSF